MRLRAIALAAAAAACAFGAPARAAPITDKKRLCPRVAIAGPDLKLNEVEKRLVCGNPDGDGWKEVPLNEAERFLRAFLQRRGYHYPVFTARGDTLEVAVGTQTLISKLVGTGLDGLIDLGKKRNVVGHALTPAELDKLKTGIGSRLQEQGYACPKVAVTADARTGVVQLDVEPGVQYILTYVQAPSIQGLDPGVFERFQAHQYGYPFDIRLLSLTSDRIMQHALFQSAYYDVSCATDGLHITQRVVEAKPHLITLGFGIDSEGYARARAQWRNSRVGYRASSEEVDVFASYREQTIDAFMHYYLRPSDHLNLVPRVTFNRDNEIPFEATEAQASLSPNWTWDNDVLHLDIMGGPQVEHLNTLRGLGPATDNFFSFQTRLNLTSHLFEYYQGDPRSGWRAAVQTDSRLRGAFSAVSSQRLRVTGEKVWNLGSFDPPWFVLATRGWAATVITPGRAETNTLIAPSQRLFLGGDFDLRGGRRQGLPDDGAGFFSAVYDGVELRVNDVLPYRIQPLLFADAAMGGRSQWGLDRDIYWSPGVGARWASPVGSFRFTIARGMVARRSDSVPTTLPHWQFFVSFGTEF